MHMFVRACGGQRTTSNVILRNAISLPEPWSFFGLELINWSRMPIQTGKGICLSVSITLESHATTHRRFYKVSLDQAKVLMIAK